MDEIGRLRELTFRSVGEGTGKAKILTNSIIIIAICFMDDDQLEIAGAYRIGEIWRCKASQNKALFNRF